jgi:O-antigen/teichoic acid export membrane protein
MADEGIEAAAAISPPPGGRGSYRPKIRDLRRGVLSGSLIMLVSSVFVGVINLIYNFAVAHKLGAGQFGHASAVYTVLMLLSSVTLSFQLLCSKFVARSDSESERIAIYNLLHRRSWLGGLGVGIVLFFSSSAVANYLNLPSPLLVQFLAVGTVFYIPLGTRRGFMQGTYDFVPLAVNFVLEVVVKLVGAVALMWGGYGVRGVVGAISASVILAYFVAIPRKHHLGKVQHATLRAGMEEGIQAVIFFIGQVIINNLDIILVKHFFDATQAGVYAAVALIGRVVYMLSWSVVSSMFPFSAGVRSSERDGRTVLSTALLLASGISALFIFAAWLMPAALWHILLGSGFPSEGHNFYSSLLVLYALTTAIYALSVVLMTYEISRKIGNVSWLQLGFSLAIIVGIYTFHDTLRSVILVQLVLMMILLLLVSLPFLRRPEPADASAASLGAISQVPHFESGLRKIRRVDENMVIAEFLRGEFYQDEFAHFRERFTELVSHPDFSNEKENTLRRALLYRRRGRLWRELPIDTEWWEVELSPVDLNRVRVFPRNQWLRYGVPSFLLPETAERIRTRILSHSGDAFIEKLRSLSLEMKQNSVFSSVILISIDEATPLTIIEGNHRVTAAIIGSPEETHKRFRYLCGFSPHMAECCWYQTDVSTLWRYAKNTVSYYLKHRHKIAAEISTRALDEPTDPEPARPRA